MNKKKVKKLEQELADANRYSAEADQIIDRLHSAKLAHLPEWGVAGYGDEVWRDDDGNRVTVADWHVIVRVAPPHMATTSSVVNISSTDTEGNLLRIPFHNEVLAKAAGLMLADVFRMKRL